MKLFVYYSENIAKGFSRSLRVAKEEARRQSCDEIQELFLPDKKGELQATLMRKWKRYRWGVCFYEYQV